MVLDRSGLIGWVDTYCKCCPDSEVQPVLLVNDSQTALLRIACRALLATTTK